jgi:hypothetical protein
VINKIFSSSSKSGQVERVTTLGFDHFEQTTEIEQVAGLDPEAFDMYREHVIRQFSIPADQQDAFRENYELASYTKSHSWNYFSTVYNADQSGTCKSSSVMSARNSIDGTFSFFVARVGASFQLAPDVQIYKTSKSSFGGLFTSEKTDIRKLPHTLTVTEAEQLSNFFDLISLDKYKKYFSAMPAAQLAALEFF